MDPVHDRGSMDLVHESGPWTRSKVGVHGPLVHVLSSPYSILGQQLSSKRKHRGVAPIHGPWSRTSKTSHLKLKREVSDGKKGSRLLLCFRVLDDVQEKKGMDL